MNKQRSLFPFHLTPGGPRLSRALLAQVPVEIRKDPDAALLLMGCRMGENPIALAEDFAGRIVGIDEDAETVFYAKMAITEAEVESRVSAQFMTPVQTNFRPGRFNVVLLEGVFSGYPVGRVLKEALRVLADDGWLLVADSCWLTDEVPTYVRELWESPDHKMHSREGLRQLLEERGLEIINLEDRSDVLGAFYQQFNSTVKGIAKGGFEGLKHMKGLVKHYKHEIDVYHKHGGRKFMGYMSAVSRRKE
ncbi:MAG: methyltransferase domain-containing protein [Bacteroidota bacterium]|nr:methyltransferase domain-containing protein [Bacteroidota bacterium]